MKLSSLLSISPCRCRNLVDHPTTHRHRSTSSFRANIQGSRNPYLQLRTSTLVNPLASSCKCCLCRSCSALVDPLATGHCHRFPPSYKAAESLSPGDVLTPKSQLALLPGTESCPARWHGAAEGVSKAQHTSTLHLAAQCMEDLTSDLRGTKLL